jgi:hypothetical protein
VPPLQWVLSRLRGIGRLVWSYLQACRASRRRGRANKLCRNGRLEEALAVVYEGLSLLRQPGVIRANPAEASMLVCLTIMVEQLAHELQQPGASEQDLRDSFSCLRALGSGGGRSVQEIRTAWFPYLQARVDVEGDRTQ